MLRIKKIEGSNDFELYQEIKTLDDNFNEINALVKLGVYNINSLITEKNNYYEMIKNLDSLIAEVTKL